MERVEALGIVLDILARVWTDNQDCPLTDDQAKKELEAQETLHAFWLELGGKP